MAPEQRRGEAVDGRADQYAFATALDEALRGGGPARLRPILARARAEDPTLRHPSMRALLAELVRARRGPWRWWFAGGGATIVAGVTFAAWMFGRAASTPPDPCPTPASPWTEARGAELRGHVSGVDPVQGATRFAAVDDTNAAIVGALLGAAHGEHAIPVRWRDAVLGALPGDASPLGTLYHPRTLLQQFV